MFRWLKSWLGITVLQNELEDTRNALNNFRGYASSKFDNYDRTERADIDVGFRGPCTVILTGVFQGRGYVQFYDVPISDFEYVVKEYKDRRKHNLVRNIDAPPQFFGTFDIR